MLHVEECWCERTKYLNCLFCSKCYYRLPVSIRGGIYASHSNIGNIYEQAVAWLKGDQAADNSTSKRSSRKVSGYVYVMRLLDLYKIGLSRTPQARLRQVVGQLPLDSEMVTVVRTDDMRSLERALHQEFADQRVKGEWFKLDEPSIERLRNLNDTRHVPTQ